MINFTGIVQTGHRQLTLLDSHCITVRSIYDCHFHGERSPSGPEASSRENPYFELSSEMPPI